MCLLILFLITRFLLLSKTDFITNSSNVSLCIVNLYVKNYNLIRRLLDWLLSLKDLEELGEIPQSNTFKNVFEVRCSTLHVS